MPQVRANQSLARAFTVLEHVAEHPGARLREVVAAVALPPATALRFLTNLVALGYLRHEGGGYVVTARLAALGRGTWRDDATDSILRVLDRLAEATGLTASLVACAGDEAVYVQRAVPRHATLLSTRRIGHRAPLYCTAVGKVFLAAHGDTAINTYVRTHACPQLTPTTLTSADALHREVAAIRRQGWACDDEECERGVRCFAVPAGALTPDLDHAVSISGPADRVGQRPQASELAHLRAAATAVNSARERPPRAV